MKTSHEFNKLKQRVEAIESDLDSLKESQRRATDYNWNDLQPLIEQTLLTNLKSVFDHTSATHT